MKFENKKSLTTSSKHIFVRNLRARLNRRNLPKIIYDRASYLFCTHFYLRRSIRVQVRPDKGGASGPSIEVPQLRSFYECV